MVLIREWSEMSGTLHSAQVAHLKLYWSLLTDSVGGVIAADIKNKIIEFRTTFKGKVNKKRTKAFLEGVEFVVGKGWA